MSHTHHNCVCSHESVKFCKTCKLVHCLDCNQEWSNYNRYFYNSYPFYSTTIAGNGYTAAGGVTSGSTWAQPQSTNFNQQNFDQFMTTGIKGLPPACTTGSVGEDTTAYTVDSCNHKG